MSTPVTRGELREELASFKKDLVTKHELRDELANFATKADLANFATKADLANFATKADLANFATKADLGGWAQALEDRLESRFDTKLDARFRANNQLLLEELGRHFRSAEEAMNARFDAFEEKYADLPGRVARLEERDRLR